MDKKAFKSEPQDLSIDVVKKRTISGIAILTFRTFILQVISFAAFGVYGAVFAQLQVGTFALVSSVKNFLAYFSDIGLAGALIQKKDKLEEDDLNTTFFIQQLLVVTLLCVLFLITPFITDFYKLSNEGVWLLRAFGISLFLSSLRTIPTVLMERKLEFSKLVIPQIIDAVVFNFLVIYLALNSYGLNSFTIAILVQGVIGLVVTYWLEPWKPKFGFSKSSLKELLKFGVPYQTNSLLAMIKDDGLTLVMGGIIGLSGLGILTWAQKWGLAPLRFFMDQVIKVTFPAFSRMQDDKDELAKALNRSILFINFLVFPSLVALVILSPLLIQIIPRYAKWEVALFALAMFAVNAAWASITTPLTNMFNAVGKINTTFRLMVMWTILSWLFIPGLGYLYGVNGAAVGFALVGSSSIVAIIVAKRYINIDLSLSIMKPLVASFGMGTILYLTKGLMEPSIEWIVILSIFGGLTYLLSMTLLIGNTLLSDARRVIYAAFGK